MSEEAKSIPERVAAKLLNTVPAFVVDDYATMTRRLFIDGELINTVTYDRTEAVASNEPKPFGYYSLGQWI